MKKPNYFSKYKFLIRDIFKRSRSVQICFLLIFFILAFVVSGPFRNTDVLLSPAEQEIDNILRSSGPDQAWKFFKEKYFLASPKETHELGHFIGQAFYEKSGVKAVTICDETQNWSCFHELVKSGMVKEGTEFIKKAGEQCQKESHQIGRCLDALGHGILYASGYDISGLKRALLICEELENAGNTLCFNGIFKEYNDRTISPFADEALSLVRSNHNPCDQVGARYQASCYYEIPYWWVVRFDKNYSLMGELCAQVRDSLAQVSCYKGVGRGVLAGTQYNRDGTALKKCHLMPNKKSSDECVLEMVAILAGTHGEKRYVTESDVYLIPKPSLEMCQELNEDKKKQCEDLVG